MIIKNPDNFFKWVVDINKTSNIILSIPGRRDILKDEIKSGVLVPSKECASVNKNFKINEAEEKAIKKLLSLFDIERNYNCEITELKLTKRL